MEVVPTEKLSFAAFERVVGQKFMIGFENNTSVELILSEALLRGTQSLRDGKEYESFSLIFRGPVDAFVPQGSYRLDQGEIGALFIFIVPIGKDENGIKYEAVFNRQKV
jgi:hypothetical protein